MKNTKVRLIVLHRDQYTVTFHDCTIMYRDGSWLQFNGLNDCDEPVTLTTSAPVEIYE